MSESRDADWTVRIGAYSRGGVMQPKKSCHITPESERTYQGLMKMIPRGQKETLGKSHLILSEKPKDRKSVV